MSTTPSGSPSTLNVDFQTSAAHETELRASTSADIERYRCIFDPPSKSSRTSAPHAGATVSVKVRTAQTTIAGFSAAIAGKTEKGAQHGDGPDLRRCAARLSGEATICPCSRGRTDDARAMQQELDCIIFR